MTLEIDKRLRLELSRARNKRRKGLHTLQQLFWECTLRCNLACLHCGSDCRAVSGYRNMPLSDFLPVLDDAARLADPRGVLVITTGGEPLLRPDIVECGREISARGFIWGMVSNGYLLSESMLESLIGAGLRTIAVSLDGFEDDHNWMRGNPHSFEKAESAIRALVRHDWIAWDVITCVNRRNLSRLDEFKRYLLGLGVRRWRIFTVFPAGRAVEHETLSLAPEQYREVMEFIKATRREGLIDLSYSCEGFLGNYEYEVRDYPFFCQAGVNVASILNDGSISGCLSIRSDLHQGNIYRDSFADVWQNRFSAYRDRRWMRTGQCADCRMWRYCEGNGLHLRGADGSLSLCNLSLCE